jgi:hypothetical protein
MFIPSVLTCQFLDLKKVYCLFLELRKILREVGQDHLCSCSLDGK